MEKLTLESLGIKNIHPNYKKITQNEKIFPKVFVDPIEKINLIHKKMSQEIRIMNKELDEVVRELKIK